MNSPLPLPPVPPLPALPPLPPAPALPPLPPPATPAESKAPESVGWYIELTKWLIGIDAGVLVFGFDKLRLSELTGLLRVGFWGSAGLLAFSIGIGILCCMQFLGYANRKESGPAAGETADDVKRYRDRGTTFYQLCAGSLWVGIVIFAGVWADSVMTRHGGAESAPAPAIVTLPDKASAVLVKPETSQGPSSVLVRDKEGKYSWLPVTVPQPPPGPSPAPAASGGTLKQSGPPATPASAPPSSQRK